MHDEYVQWYEAFLLVMLYGVYICIMYYDKSIQNFAKGWCLLKWLGIRSSYMLKFITEMCCYTGSWKCVSDMLKKNGDKPENAIAAENGMW